MHMKEDHMGNGQLKPGYNLQASSNNQYITNYTLAQITADTTIFKDHLTEHYNSYNENPQYVTADAGYGSEENYTYLEEKEITGFVKYNYFHKEQHDKKRAQDPFLADNLFYNENEDAYYCPNGAANAKHQCKARPYQNRL